MAGAKGNAFALYLLAQVKALLWSGKKKKKVQELSYHSKQKFKNYVSTALEVHLITLEVNNVMSN